VHGIKRRASSFNSQRIDHLYQDPHASNNNFILHYGDMTDSLGLTRLIEQIKPDEIYNLASQSHVAVSFETPEYTANVDGLGTLRLLEAIRFLNLQEKCRFYQASTSELFGEVSEAPQTENTPFNPRSPYAVAKLYAFWTVKNYRDAYGIYACNGILFNHESPRRGETFVTRKITRGLARIALGLEECLYLGNLDAKRDWGHAQDYAEAQWLMLQQSQPDDYVVATGKQNSVRQFVLWAANYLGIHLEFSGSGNDEIGKVKAVSGNLVVADIKDKIIIKIDPKYLRPLEVNTLVGDPSKAKEKLGWEAKIAAQLICTDMVSEDYASLKYSQLQDPKSQFLAEPAKGQLK